MRRISRAVASLVFLATAAVGHAQTRATTGGVWTIDPARSDVRFTVTKLGFDDVTGVFRESEGEIRYDPARPAESAITWRVRVASVQTEATMRDRTLQSPEYFDAVNHPWLSFQSRGVRALENGHLEVAGDISIRGVTRPETQAVDSVPHALGQAAVVAHHERPAGQEGFLHHERRVLFPDGRHHDHVQLRQRDQQRPVERDPCDPGGRRDQGRPDRGHEPGPGPLPWG